MKGGGHAPVVRLDLPTEKSEQLVAGAGQILGSDGSLVAAGDQHAPTENLGTVAGADQGRAVGKRAAATAQT
jgi:hypothetical protein